MVGYKQPPVHTRFQKGQSGNPKGRPKKAETTSSGMRTANSLALQEVEHAIKVREGDSVREMVAIEAVLRAQTKSAISGNAFAQRDVINRYEKAETERRKKIAEDCEFFERYVERCREEIAVAAAKGEPPPKLLPHPDDIIIDYKKGVSVPGPANEEEVVQLEQTLRLRDLYIMQDALDRRSWPKSKDKSARERPSRSLMLAMIMNDTVPKRFQLSEGAFMSRILGYQIWTKRTLMKSLYRGWRSAGMPMPRGTTFRPMAGFVTGR